MTVILSCMSISIIFVMKNQYCVKLIFAILLMSTVACGEIVNIMSVSGIDICLMDTAFEGESEKDTSEQMEDISKVKIKQNVNFLFLSNNQRNKNASLARQISTPYLEIHSPPPEQV